MADWRGGSLLEALETSGIDYALGGALATAHRIGRWDELVAST